MKVITYTLVGDGPSDRSLVPLTDLVLSIRFPSASTAGTFADSLPSPSEGLRKRVGVALKNFPCDLLLIHRDAEREEHEKRVVEISEATAGIHIPVVAVVPVRMMEAWLLQDAVAIRRASGNPNGTTPLDLPANPACTEDDPNPKKTLRQALLTASELNGRRLKTFDTGARTLRVAELTCKIERLRAMPSFNRFEEDLVKAVTELCG